MASIARALARIKEDVRSFVPDESVRRACRAAGHRWRERRLGPVETVHLFVLQVVLVLQAGAAVNLKRVHTWEGADISPWQLFALTETKTTWHPIGG